MKYKQEIVIIGGGIGGCLTALMLAKNPDFHITIVEEKESLLTGASLAAAQLHLGGEYPTHEKTALDCLRGAILWKLLMPKDIYTKVPPKMFLIDQETQAYGERNPQDKDALTLNKYEAAYETIRREYEGIFKEVQKANGWDEETTGKALFGSYEKGKFYYRFDESTKNAYKDYTNIAGGFQTQEIGLNVPKYLAMIQSTVEKTKNITVMTNTRVCSNGISGELGNFEIACDKVLEDGKTQAIPPLKADQVVQAAWQGGMEISGSISTDKEVDDTEQKVVKKVDVFKRSMLVVDLPKGWEVPPAFIMKGAHGGMLSPYNDKIALVYIPTYDAAYVNQTTLTEDDPCLSKNWKDGLSPEAKEKLLKSYMKEAQRRFPILKYATNPRLIIRDTLNFQDYLSQREDEEVNEVASGGGMGLVLKQSQGITMKMMDRPPMEEVQKGHFMLYPTKATYAVHAALQAEAMVTDRYHDSDRALIEAPKDVLVEKIIKGRDMQNVYTLADMKMPRAPYMATFFRQHQPLSPEMMDHTWAKQPGRINNNPEFGLGL